MKPTGLLSLFADPEMLAWQDHAACKGADADLFFPERGESTRDAKRICRGCPVRSECLEWALSHEKFGIWGGRAERERRRMRQVQYSDTTEGGTR